MGNYRQHVGFAGFCGLAYAWGAFVLAGLHWLYGSVAALLATLGGLLPDLDSDSGIEMRGFTGVLGVLAAMAVWQHIAVYESNLPFELHLWACILAYLAVRHGLRRIVSKLTVHRGISHSLPMGAVWGAFAYLYYPSPHHIIRALMALAIMVGFLSHLLLDEMCSVDLAGRRVNKAFGTALKLWAPSPWSTLAIYGLLSYLAWRIIGQWPEGSPLDRLSLPRPKLDFPWPPPLDLGRPRRP